MNRQLYSYAVLVVVILSVAVLIHFNVLGAKAFAEHLFNRFGVR